MWSYYDFDANWSTVYSTWQSDAVQDVLYPHMQDWAEEMRSGEVWVRGADLWKYSRTDYHYAKMLEDENQYIEEYNILNTYMKQRLQLGLKPYTDDECNDDPLLWRLFESISDECRPKPHSLRAMCMIAGANYLAEAYLKTAQILMPSNDIRCMASPDDDLLIGNLDTQQIFDFGRYYLWKYDDVSMDATTVMSGFVFTI
jgi:hypothetical protein